ncbi:MAG TPA: hypothetical protein VMF08_21455 [Candidatus Sulfotelmatobacter sp.]|nr:hypothetical protein [Candidatus Sulfotelmatobacter sp.]
MKKLVLLALLASVFVYFSPNAQAAGRHHKHRHHHHRRHHHHHLR